MAAKPIKTVKITGLSAVKGIFDGVDASAGTVTALPTSGGGNADFIEIVVEGQAVRMTLDGQTPTSTFGILLPVMANAYRPFRYQGPLVNSDGTSHLKFIETAASATIFLTFWRG